MSPKDVQVVDDIRVTGLARTAIDIGREHGFEAGTVAVDAAMRRGVTRDQFLAELELMTN